MTGKTPELLIIGAQKAGSTWLSQMLNRHPEIWMPPTKELHYFDNLWPDSFLLNYLVRIYTNNRNSTNIDFDKMMWFAKFALQRPRTDEWYKELFVPAGDRIACDCTPAYSMLDEENVQHVHRLMPDTKVLFILRNPLDRIWSHYNFSAPWRDQGIEDDKLTDVQIWAELQSDPYHLRTDYVRTLDLWGKYFPSEQLSVQFYDQVKSDPIGLVSSVFDYVGVSRLEEAQLSKAYEAVNVTDNSLPRREAIDRKLAERYAPMVEELAARYGEIPARWLENCNRILT